MSLEEMNKRVAEGKCPFCGKDMSDAKFRDKESLREYKISGMCQTCQDDFFGGN